LRRRPCAYNAGWSSRRLSDGQQTDLFRCNGPPRGTPIHAGLGGGDRQYPVRYRLFGLDPGQHEHGYARSSVQAAPQQSAGSPRRRPGHAQVRGPLRRRGAAPRSSGAELERPAGASKSLLARTVGGAPAPSRESYRRSHEAPGSSTS